MSDTFDLTDLISERDFWREGEKCRDCNDGVYIYSKKGKLYCSKFCWLKK